MPARRKPDHLKLLTGTFRPDRAAPTGANLPPLTETPPPPDWLPNAHAVREWKRLVPFLIGARLLTETALSALGHLCALHGKLVQLWSAGETPTGHLVSQYRLLAADFGLSLLGQQKLKPGPTPADRDGNPFAAIREEDRA